MYNISSQAANYTENRVSSSCTRSVRHPWQLLLTFIIYVVIIILSVVGNSLLVLVIRRIRRFHTPTHFLIINLCVADLTITLFSTAYSAYVTINDGIQWWGGFSGVAACKLLIFIQGVSITCSIFTLVFLAVDRFCAVVLPLRRLNTLRVVKGRIAVTWIASAIVVSPMLYAMKVGKHSGRYICYENWNPVFDHKKARKEYELAYFGLSYVLPLLVIAVLYSRAMQRLWFRRIPGNVTAANEEIALKSRKKVLRMLVAIVTVFAFCWLPLQILRLLVVFPPKSMKCPLPNIVVFLFFTFGFANSALNPAICFAFNKDYRIGARSLLPYPCGKRNYVLPEQGTVLRLRATTNRTSHFVSAGV